MGILYDLFVCDHLDDAPAMIMVFLLVVMVDGELVSTNDMLFENVYRCNQGQINNSMFGKRTLALIVYLRQ